ncbi:MAG: hypothetical protein HYS26_04840 [Candidatus Kaiserbacteria bacterium]|nr:MAG: hypothetical protein HYS26_04840 [Candidatus Kaiserbacteria bacterium]
MNLSAKSAGYALAAIVAIVGNTLLTIAKESYEPLLQAMKAALGHHWTTHGVVIVASFFILGYLFSRWPAVARMSGTMLAIVLVIATILSGVGLFVFFLAK